MLTEGPLFEVPVEYRDEAAARIDEAEGFYGDLRAANVRTYGGGGRGEEQGTVFSTSILVRQSDEEPDVRRSAVTRRDPVSHEITTLEVRFDLDYVGGGRVSFEAISPGTRRNRGNEMSYRSQPPIEPGSINTGVPLAERTDPSAQFAQAITARRSALGIPARPGGAPVA